MWPGAAIIHLLVQYIRCEYFLLPAVVNIDQVAFNKYGGALAGVVGASGAIMGVMAAFAYLFPNTELYIWGAFPVKAKWAVLGYVAIDLFGGFGNIKGDNVAHFAHLGGAVTGFILFLYGTKPIEKRCISKFFIRRMLCISPTVVLLASPVATLRSSSCSLLSK
ncbi:MAG: rhomboid family intramembrane serine protease [Chitinophagaceae bacterium]